MIIACGATKRHDAGLLAAIERYDGPPYKTLRKALRELAQGQQPDIRILSAEFGLIAAEAPIPNYDHRMAPPRALALRGQVREALATTLATGDYTATFINLGADYRPALALGHGELYGATGFPLSPPFSPVRWLNAVLCIVPGVFADWTGIVGERQIKNRWLRHTPITITVAITPAPPRAAWDQHLPGVVCK
jgi:hypothetical protein